MSTEISVLYPAEEQQTIRLVRLTEATSLRVKIGSVDFILKVVGRY